MDAGHVIPEAIQALLEKRTTFQDWLSRLDELGSDFRPEVAEKVRSDYEGRLTEVEGELEGHRAELESALAERSQTADRIAGQHDAHRSELEETELRHAVGEFDEDEWERRRSEHQSEIDDLEADLTAHRSAVESLQTVLGELTGAATVAAPVELEPPIVEELAAAVDEAPEAVEVVEAEEESAWMSQPFEDGEPGTEQEEAVEEESADAEFAEAKVAEADTELAEETDVAERESEAEPILDEAEPGEFKDELEFLESLSLDDADNFDAVSALLDDDDAESGADEGSQRKTEDL